MIRRAMGDLCHVVRALMPTPRRNMMATLERQLCEALDLAESLLIERSELAEENRQLRAHILDLEQALNLLDRAEHERDHAADR